MKEDKKCIGSNTMEAFALLVLVNNHKVWLYAKNHRLIPSEEDMPLVYAWEETRLVPVGWPEIRSRQEDQTKSYSAVGTTLFL